MDIQKRLLFPIFLVLSAVAGSLNAAGSGAARNHAEVLLTDFCNSLIELKHTNSTMISDPLNGSIYCPCTNPVVHNAHTRAGEAVFPFALLYSRTGKRKYLDSAFQLGWWLIDQQAPDGSWTERPHSWRGTTVHQLFALAASYNLLASQFKLEKELNTRWREALRSAREYVKRTVSDGTVPLSYLPTAACALKLCAEIIPDRNSAKKQQTLIQSTLFHVNKDNFFVPATGEGVDIGTDLCQTIPMLALYSVITKDSGLKTKLLRIMDSSMKFFGEDGIIDASWGSRIYRWTMWGSMGTYGAVPGFALLSDKRPLYKKAALKNMQLMRRSFHKIGSDIPPLLCYGPNEFCYTNPKDICIYPTVLSAVGLAVALHWGDLSGAIPDTPLAGGTFFDKIPSCEIALVRFKDITATVCWSSKPSVTYPPRGGTVTHLFFSDIGTIQCATPSLFIRPEFFHLPRQQGIYTLTPRIEFKENNIWFSNLFDRNTRLVEFRKDNPKIRLEGTLCDSSGRSSNVGFEMTYRFSDHEIQKTLYLFGKDINQAIVMKEPFLYDQEGVTITENIEDQIKFHTSRGTYVISLDDEFEGVILETLDRDSLTAYRPLLPGVQAIPVEIRFVDNNASKARWRITKIK